jgi:hypothetical protein
MKNKWVGLARTASVYCVITFALFANRGFGACELTPSRSTNAVNSTRNLTASVTDTNGDPAAAVLVTFRVLSGPNTGTNGTSLTGAGGNASFTYRGAAGAGTDILAATGSVNGVAFSCMSTQVWTNASVVVVGEPPQISCPGNITTNANNNSCERRDLAFAVNVTAGVPMPTVACRVGSTPVTSGSDFPLGTSTVTCTASNTNGVATCSFTVTVIGSPPNITCPNDVVVDVDPGTTSTPVSFDNPQVETNCAPIESVTFNPPSGSEFQIGTTPVTVTATDQSGASSTCTFNVVVQENGGGGGDIHDLAIVSIKAPRRINLSQFRPTITKRIVVTVQNRSTHFETFSDPAQILSLVTLQVYSLDPMLAPDLEAFPLEVKPQRLRPFSLKPKGKVNVYFNVTFDNYINGAKGLGQEDYGFYATVNHQAIDGNPDAHPECDTCPRGPLEGFVDPYPDGRIRDRGCGGKFSDGTLGADILTDVVVK